MQGEELEEGVIREDETNVDNEREEEQSWRSSSPEVTIGACNLSLGLYCDR